MEPEGSLPYSQVPGTRPYPEPTPSNFLKIHLNIICNTLPFWEPGFWNNMFKCSVVMEEMLRHYLKSNKQENWVIFLFG
jgi:hypothetical protein